MEASIYRLKYRDVLTLCVIALLGIGVLMVQSASMRVTGQMHWQWTAPGVQHVKFAIAALCTYFIVGKFDYKWLGRGKLLRNPTAWFLVISGVLCFMVLVPGMGKEINGAKRWLKFPPIQPSELGKWAVVLFLSYCLAFRPFDLSRFFGGFLPMVLPLGALLLLVVISDFGTAALIGVCIVCLCLVGRVRWWHLAIVLIPALLIGFWFVHHKHYRWQRITAFVDPYKAPQKEGYHMIQSLLSFSTGGVAGRGLGNGVQKLGYLPEDTTDFIFSVVCEELGLFGALLTIVLYLGIIFVAWQTIRRPRDSFGRLLAFGTACMIGFQALINIAVATVSVPTKGLSLPLISAGGTGLIITCGALGLLYSIARHEHPLEELAAPVQPQRKRLPQWDITSTDLATAL
jgi:cell division protein FtsW